MSRTYHEKWLKNAFSIISIIYMSSLLLATDEGVAKTPPTPRQQGNQTSQIHVQQNALKNISFNTPNHSMSSSSSSPLQNDARASLMGGDLTFPDDTPLPDALSPWLPWVQRALIDLKCAKKLGRPLCQWATHLSIDLQESGARLNMDVSLDQSALVPLPHQDFTALDRLLSQAEGESRWVERPIIHREGRPWVRLDRGRSLIKMKMSWAQLPDFIMIPTHIGRVTLSDQGVERAWTERDGRGALWLKNRHDRQRQSEEVDTTKRDTLNVQVYRAFHDDVPLRVETLIHLNVSGRAREVVLSDLQLDSTQLIALETALSSEWVKGGLRLYLKPGRKVIKLNSVLPRPVSSITVPRVRGGEVAPQEIWVWNSRENLRSVTLTGLDEIDPEFTSLPNTLRSGTHTLIAKPGSVLSIKELKRDLSRPPENKLDLHRKIWLDLDGKGIVIRDDLSGILREGTRLNYSQVGVLGKAELKSDEGPTPLLITVDPKTKLEGVEVRETQLKVEVDSRLEDVNSSIPAVGWAHTLQSLSVTINLPLGWTLLGVKGAEGCEEAWISSWGIMNFFLIFLITFAIAKLFGWKWAGLTLLTLILYHNETRAPQWMWISLLVSVALLRVSVTFKNFQWLTRGLFIFCALPFAMTLLNLCHHDLKSAIHPQLEHSSRINSSYNASPFISRRAIMIKGGHKKANKYAFKSSNRLQQLDQNAIVQTGPGVPTWTWSRYDIKFIGPIEADRMLELWMLPPMWNRLFKVIRSLSIISIFLMILMSARKALISFVSSIFDNKLKPKRLNSLLIFIFLVSALFSLNSPNDCEAQTLQPPQQSPIEIEATPPPPPPPPPPPVSSVHQHSSTPPSSPHPLPRSEHLEQLKSRLIEAHSCVGECLYLPHMNIDVKGDVISVVARVHAEQDTALTLPGLMSAVQWSAVTLDGTPALLRGSKKGEEMTLRVRVPKGVHTLKARAKIAPIDVLPLSFHDAPRLLGLTLDGWRRESDGGERVEGALELRRLKSVAPSVDKDAQNISSEEPSKLAIVNMDLSWYIVERSLVLGPTWQISTTIRRVSKNDMADHFTLPLIKGERVLSDQFEVTSTGVRVAFKDGQHEVMINSELPITEHIELSAPKDVRWTEKWTLSCGVIWQCDSVGLKPISHLGETDQNIKEWMPWPTQSVHLNILRPKGVKGTAATVQEMTYLFTPGPHLAKGQVTLEITASRGGAQSLTLPKEAQEIITTTQGIERYDLAQNGVVRLPLQPGQNTFQVQWTQRWERRFKERVPQVSLDLETVNFTQRIQLGKRWLLWIYGPQWGPAVLFWGHLALYLLLALILGYKKWSPLASWEWCLLFIGFTQLPAALLIVVIGWFGILTFRQRFGGRIKGKLLFDFMQLSIAGASLIFFMSLYGAIYSNLLSQIDMQVEGANSSSFMLQWYVDRFSDISPEVGFYSMSHLVWKGVMLIWSLWLVIAFLRWVKWGWVAWLTEGGWRPIFHSNTSESNKNAPSED